MVVLSLAINSFVPMLIEADDRFDNHDDWSANLSPMRQSASIIHKLIQRIQPRPQVFPLARPNTQKPPCWGPRGWKRLEKRTSRVLLAVRHSSRNFKTTPNSWDGPVTRQVGQTHAGAIRNRHESDLVLTWILGQNEFLWGLARMKSQIRASVKEKEGK
jgi:hypothetical protein